MLLKAILAYNISLPLELLSLGDVCIYKHSAPLELKRWVTATLRCDIEFQGATKSASHFPSFINSR
jgi:hypothetical protein